MTPRLGWRYATNHQLGIFYYCPSFFKALSTGICIFVISNLQFVDDRNVLHIPYGVRFWIKSWVHTYGLMHEMVMQFLSYGKVCISLYMVGVAGVKSPYIFPHCPRFLNCVACLAFMKLLCNLFGCLYWAVCLSTTEMAIQVLSLVEWGLDWLWWSDYNWGPSMPWILDDSHNLSNGKLIGCSIVY